MADPRGRLTESDRKRLERAARVVEEWLTLQEREADRDPDLDGDDLLEVSALVLAEAPDAQLRAAVYRARDEGWGWGPIAMLLGQSAQQAKERWS